MQNSVCKRNFGSSAIFHGPHNEMIVKKPQKIRKNMQILEVFGQKLAVRGPDDKK